MKLFTTGLLWSLVVYLFIHMITIPARAGDVNGSMTFGGKTRTYLLHVPTGYNASAPTPLVFVFHGLTCTGSTMSQITDFSPLADQEKFLVVYPDGVDKKWSLPDGNIDDIGFISALIDLLSSSYNIDEDRIFAAGASNGGMFTYRIGLELTDRFAAIASVAGYLPNYGPSSTPVPTRPLSVIHFHGTADLIMPYDAAEEAVDYWVDFNTCTPIPLTVQLPNVDITDGTTVDKMIYADGSDNTEVNLFKINGGGHTWPGTSSNAMPGNVCKDINASEIIWEFFKDHPQNEAPTVSFTQPVSGVEFTAPASIYMKATALDNDGSIKNVEFFNGLNSLKKDFTQQYSYTWKNVPTGRYTIIAVASDDDKATASDTITVTVKPLKTSFVNTENNFIEAFYDPSCQQFVITKMNDLIEYDLCLYDAFGRRILSFQNTEDLKKIISTGTFSVGMYLYVIIIKDMNSLTGKFIVTR